MKRASVTYRLDCILEPVAVCPQVVCDTLLSIPAGCCGTPTLGDYTHGCLERAQANMVHVSVRSIQTESKCYVKDQRFHAYQCL